MSSDGIAYRKGDAAEGKRHLQERRFPKLSWVFVLAVLVVVVVLYAALGYAVYVVARTLF